MRLQILINNDDVRIVTGRPYLVHCQDPERGLHSGRRMTVSLESRLLSGQRVRLCGTQSACSRPQSRACAKPEPKRSPPIRKPDSVVLAAPVGPYLGGHLWEPASGGPSRSEVPACLAFVTGKPSLRHASATDAPCGPGGAWRSQAYLAGGPHRNHRKRG
jgi:hypothetical protein